MRVPGVKTAKTFSRWLQARILGGAMILGYHRVVKLSRDESQTCVAPGNFAEHMDAISRYASPISLTNLVKRLKEGSVPPRSVAVTFDDGYVDNLYNAKPVLEKFAIPAIVFVCTGYVGREFWWDELDRLVMSSQANAQVLHLKVSEDKFVWDQPRGRAEADPDVRVKFRRALYHFLLALDVEEQNHAMESIRSWSGVPSSETTTRAMNQTELLQLAEGGLIEIGAHTRHHPMLPRLSLEQQRMEIVSSKQDLESLLGKRVDGFAYPNGRTTEDAKRIAREAGFTFACTSLHDVVRPGSDMFELTRFWQRNVDGDRFMQYLKLWMTR